MFYLSWLNKGDIFIDIPETDFKSVVFHIVQTFKFSDKKEIFEKIIAREQMGTTVVGNGIAIPHCRLKDFNGVYVKFALFRKSPGCVSPAGEEIRFMFLIVGAESDPGYYLRVLSHIVKVMKNGSVRKELMQAKNEKEICRVFAGYESDNKSEAARKGREWK